MGAQTPRKWSEIFDHYMIAFIVRFVMNRAIIQTYVVLVREEELS